MILIEVGVFFLVIYLRDGEKIDAVCFEMIPEVNNGLLNGSRIKLEAEVVKPENTNFYVQKSFK